MQLSMVMYTQVSMLSLPHGSAVFSRVSALGTGETITNCDGCSAINHELKRCSGCKHAFYCNEKCQSSHWGQHKNICMLIQGKRGRDNNEKDQNDRKKQQTQRAVFQGVDLGVDGYIGDTRGTRLLYPIPVDQRQPDQTRTEEWRRMGVETLLSIDPERVTGHHQYPYFTWAHHAWKNGTLKGVMSDLDVYVLGGFFFEINYREIVERHVRIVTFEPPGYNAFRSEQNGIALVVQLNSKMTTDEAAQQFIANSTMEDVQKWVQLPYRHIKLIKNGNRWWYLVAYYKSFILEGQPQKQIDYYSLIKERLTRVCTFVYETRTTFQGQRDTDIEYRFNPELENPRNLKVVQLGPGAKRYIISIYEYDIRNHATMNWLFSMDTANSVTRQYESEMRRHGDKYTKKQFIKYLKRANLNTGTPGYELYDKSKRLAGYIDLFIQPRVVFMDSNGDPLSTAPPPVKVFVSASVTSLSDYGIDAMFTPHDDRMHETTVSDQQQLTTTPDIGVHMLAKMAISGARINSLYPGHQDRSPYVGYRCVYHVVERRSQQWVVHGMLPPGYTPARRRDPLFKGSAGVRISSDRNDPLSNMRQYWPPSVVFQGAIVDPGTLCYAVYSLSSDNITVAPVHGGMGATQDILLLHRALSNAINDAAAYTIDVFPGRFYEGVDNTVAFRVFSRVSESTLRAFKWMRRSTVYTIYGGLTGLRLLWEVTAMRISALPSRPGHWETSFRFTLASGQSMIMTTMDLKWPEDQKVRERYASTGTSKERVVQVAITRMVYVKKKTRKSTRAVKKKTPKEAVRPSPVKPVYGASPPPRLVFPRRTAVPAQHDQLPASLPAPSVDPAPLLFEPNPIVLPLPNELPSPARFDLDPVFDDPLDLSPGELEDLLNIPDQSDFESDLFGLSDPNNPFDF
jgi:hypothetical protein